MSCQRNDIKTLWLYIRILKLFCGLQREISNKNLKDLSYTYIYIVFVNNSWIYFQIKNILLWTASRPLVSLAFQGHSYITMHVCTRNSMQILLLWVFNTVSQMDKLIDDWKSSRPAIFHLELEQNSQWCPPCWLSEIYSINRMAPEAFEEDRLRLAKVNTESPLMAYITPLIFSLTFS